MMTTREDTLTAWNDYQDALRHCSDTSQERAEQEKHLRSQLAVWDKLDMMSVMFLPALLLFFIVSVVAGNFLVVLLFGALGSAACIYSNSKDKKIRGALNYLHNQAKVPAQKHHKFITTVTKELRTQGYTVLDVNTTADIPYIVTSAGVVTVAVINNTPELRLGDQPIYPAYRDTTAEPVTHTRLA